MSFPRYQNYRDSGVHWIGAMPAHWKPKPFWTLFKRIKRTGHPDEMLLSVYRDFGVVVKSSRDDNFNNASEDLGLYQLVEPGDLAINKMKAWQGSVGVASVRGIVSPAYFVYTATHQESSKYLHYLLRSAEYIAGYLSFSKGIRVNQWDLDPQYHSRMPIFLPPPEEQSAIVTFLDRETAKIDALVGEQKRLIELLKEKRQAVISHAVTKGLDPNAPMKDSGIEWLGEVPVHWELSKVGRHTAIRSGYTFPSTGFSDDPSDIRLLRGINVGPGEIRWDETVYWRRQPLDGLDEFELSNGNIIVGMDRPWIAGGMRVAKIASKDLPALLLQRVCAISTSADLDADFLMFHIGAKAFMDCLAPETTGVSVPHISPGQIANFRIPLPPIHEQLAIIHRISEVTDGIDALVAEAEVGMKLLQERRSALISAAVTGKINVRCVVSAQAEAA